MHPYHIHCMLAKGEVTAPDIVTDFFKVLYTGSSCLQPNDRTHFFIGSVSDDVIYAVTNGDVKPS